MFFNLGNAKIIICSDISTLFMNGVLRNNIIFFKEVESTNQKAISIIKENTKSLPFVVSTDFQTLGKGQLQNKWESENGKNILISVAIKTNIKLENKFILNVIASLAVLDLLDYFHLENTSVKWPNDILVENRKIAGILIQNKVLLEIITTSIIGIGLNINQSHFSQFTRDATSVKNENITNLSISEIIDRLLDLLQLRFSKLDSENWKDYFEKLYLKDKLSPFEINGTKQMGIVKEVKRDGAIVLETADGIRKFQIQQIKFLI
tara:strand:- start:213 stop:1004 length:792 start_codon:yes stop_codon:yes gene_type:complete